MRKIRFLPLILMMAVFILSSCGAMNMAEISGEWTLWEVNGAGLNQYAAALGREACTEAVNFIISKDELTAITFYGEQAVSIKAAENGFAILENGEESIPVTYDADKDSLTFSTEEFTYTFIRGSFEF